MWELPLCLLKTLFTNIGLNSGLSFTFQLVVLTFWGIYAVDRELIFPRVLDKIIPASHNHILVSKKVQRNYKVTIFNI